MKSWDLFVKEIFTRFGDPQPERTAADKLASLKQTGSASDYATTFNSLANRLDEHFNLSKEKWNGYERGLKPDVRLAIATMPTPPGSFNDLVNFSITIDNQLFKNRSFQVRPVITMPRHVANATPTSASTGTNYAPMDLDTASTGIPPKGQRITEEEKDRRRKNGLCFYCGGKHKLSDCPEHAKVKNFRR